MKQTNNNTNHQLVDAEPKRAHENLIDLSGFPLRQIRNELPILHGFNTRLRAKPTNPRAKIRPKNTLTSRFTTQSIRKKDGKIPTAVRKMHKCID